MTIVKGTKRKYNEISFEANRECILSFYIDKNSVEWMKYIIENFQKDVNERFEYGKSLLVTPLWLSVFKEKMAIVKLLVEKNADVNKRPILKNNKKNVSHLWNTTPLLLACRIKSFAIAKFLIEKGADVNLSDTSGYTCLMYSVDSPEFCQYLIMNGAKINVRNADQDTVLHVAINKEYFETAHLLLSSGANPCILNKKFEDAFNLLAINLFSFFAHLSDEERFQIFEKFLTFVPSSFREKFAGVYELLGAGLNTTRFKILCWKKAVEIRDKIGIYKQRLPINDKNLIYFHYYQEIIQYRNYIHDELLNIIGREKREFIDNEDLNSMNTDVDRCIQSFFIFERILRPWHDITVMELINLCDAYVAETSIDKATKVLLYGLSLKVDKENEYCVKYIITHFIKICHIYLREIDFDDIFHLFSLVLGKFFQLRVTLLEDIIQLLFITLDKCLYDEVKKKKLYEFVRKYLIPLNLKNKEGNPLLHQVINCVCSHICFPQVFNICRKNNNDNDDDNDDHRLRSCYLCVPELIVPCLLDCGINVNTLNHKKHSPLFLIVRDSHFINKPAIVEALINFGAHVDQTQKNNKKTPYNYLIKRYPSMRKMVNNKLTLRCFAARAIKKYKIHYQDKIPHNLETFIKLH